MPNYVSIDGKWHAAKEHVVLPHLQGTDKEVYDGPDRAALFEMFKAGVASFGKEFRHDAEFLLRVKNLGFDNVEDYLKYVGYDEEKVKKTTEEKVSKVTKHSLPKRVKAIKKLGGGTDFAGQGDDKYGGFGERK